MAAPLNAQLPPNLDLGPGFTLRVTALAVSDGSVVILETGPYMLVPGPNG